VSILIIITDVLIVIRLSNERVSVILNVELTSDDTIVLQVCVCVCVCRSVGSYITEDDAQEALLGAISQRYCYGKAAANEMDIYQIISSCALHVSLLLVTLS